MDPIYLKVIFLDGSEKTLEVLPPDIIAFEEKYEKSIDAIELMTHFYFLAWHIETRLKETARTLEEWVATIRGITFADPKGSKG